MANPRNALTASNVKYLLAMYRLHTANNPIRCVKIAQELNVTKPSVHTMIKTLKDMGMVNKNLYGEVFFTEEGLKLATRYSDYYNAVSGLFKAYLSDDGDISSTACVVLAEISEESLSLLCEKQSAMAKEKE